MKNIKRKLVSSFCILFLFTALSSCSSSSFEDYKGKVSVCVLSAEHATVKENLRYVARESNVKFEIAVDKGFSLASTDYTDYEITALGDNCYSLVLQKITYPVNVSLGIEKNATTLYYYPNGGEVIAGGEYYSESVNLTKHKRANTSHGVYSLKREGYSQVGWNTKADLSGESVGLGSRVSVDSEIGYADLYAVWEQWTDLSHFTYDAAGENITILSYSGQDDKVVIPYQINGKDVTAIASNAFDHCQAKTIVFPYTLTMVSAAAFSFCDLETLYLYDDLLEISDASFVSCPNFSTVHINAINYPVYAANNRHSYYADKVDMLILSLDSDKPRMIFEGDSGIWFNLNGEKINEAFGENYTICNIALNGFFNAVVQYSAMEHYLRKGDVFVHVTTPNSGYQLLEKCEMTQNMFTSLELNYDLFSFVDIRKMTSVFDAYADYISVKSQMEEQKYSDLPATDWIDSSGCVPFYMPECCGDEDLGDDATISTDIFSDEQMNKLNAFYDEVYSITGNKILYGFGCVNYDGLCDEQRTIVNCDNFENTCKTYFSSHVTFVDHLKDNVKRGHNFYYTDFHLNTDAGKIYTEGLALNIQGALNR